MAAGDGRKGCLMVAAIPLVILFAIFNFVFVFLPLLIVVKLRRLLGRPKRP
ncbi:MAG TPA: hypothetical protein VMG08_01130 [Allosphingosinicella sp.]|nr:hypothetical protein [Allosphingosinicella sp.]